VVENYVRNANLSSRFGLKKRAQLKTTNMNGRAVMDLKVVGTVIVDTV